MAAVVIHYSQLIVCLALIFRSQNVRFVLNLRCSHIVELCQDDCSVSGLLFHYLFKHGIRFELHANHKKQKHLLKSTLICIVFFIKRIHSFHFHANSKARQLLKADHDQSYLQNIIMYLPSTIFSSSRLQASKDTSIGGLFQMH